MAGKVATVKDIKPGRQMTSQNRWPLIKARAWLGRLVRDMQARGPQRVTRYGRDAAVIVSAKDFDRVHGPVSGRDIVKAMRSPLVRDVVF